LQKFQKTHKLYITNKKQTKRFKDKATIKLLIYIIDFFEKKNTKKFPKKKLLKHKNKLKKPEKTSFCHKK
jgi:hypothetical protein